MAFTNVVVSGVPFHAIVELAAKPEPFTVRVKAAPPACALDGFRLLIIAAGNGVIENADPFDIVPLAPTVIVAVPSAPISDAATEPVN